MATINPNYSKLAAGYLFPEIARRTKAFQEADPFAEVMKLGIGNTTEPLPRTVALAMKEAADRMLCSRGYLPFELDVKDAMDVGKRLRKEGGLSEILGSFGISAEKLLGALGVEDAEKIVSKADADIIAAFTAVSPNSTVATVLHEAGLDQYSGYGDEQGNTALRKAIAGQYSKMGAKIEPDEVFVSDGAKPDSGNIQSIFGLENIVAVQDPAYPVYVDTNVIAGRTGEFDENTKQYKGFVYMPCNRENLFKPKVPEGKVDLIYLCSPNNPTGAVMTKEELKEFVDYARENKAIIIFDAAYAPFISDPNLPKTIYEVEGAKECAIEINSFSKSAGFTGVRLGWTVVPKDLATEDKIIYDDKGNPVNTLNRLWNRRQCTFFNGASNVVQAGGLAALTEQGQEECQKLVDFYKENAKIIRQGLEKVGLIAFGGENSPYIWMQTPNGMGSWDFFDKLLNETHVVGTPGVGFGPSGEGYFRLSSFGHRENIEKAVDSIVKNLKL